MYVNRLVMGNDQQIWCGYMDEQVRITAITVWFYKLEPNFVHTNY